MEKKEEKKVIWSFGEEKSFGVFLDLTLNYVIIETVMLLVGNIVSLFFR